jgi:3-methyladenine DNA glycosylase AlkD
MSVQEIIDELNSMGNEATKRTLLKHGAKEPFFGVKIEDLKRIQKRIKKDYKLALELYDTGISDAMYLAGLIADDARMTIKDLRKWAKEAYWSMLSDYTVPWVAAESPHGRELALEWIESPKENIAVAGWATLSSLVAIKDDAELDLPELKRLLDRVGKTIHDQPGRVPPCHERVCDRGGLLCFSTDRGRPGNRAPDRQGLGRYGRYFLQSTVGPRIHSQGSKARFGRQEA